MKTRWRVHEQKHTALKMRGTICNPVPAPSPPESLNQTRQRDGETLEVLVKNDYKIGPETFYEDLED